MPSRDLQGFLAGVADEVAPIVGFEGLGAVAFAPERGFRSLAAWNASVIPQPGETPQDLHRRTMQMVGVPLPARTRVPYDEEEFRRLSAGGGISCADLLAKDAWYEYEFALAASGMRSYTSASHDEVRAFVREVEESPRDPIPFYMALIDPFRRLIVYPSLLLSVRTTWNEAFGQPARE